MGDFQNSICLALLQRGNQVGEICKWFLQEENDAFWKGPLILQRNHNEKERVELKAR